MSLPAVFLALLRGRGIPMMAAFGTADVALDADDAIAAARALAGIGVAVCGNRRVDG
jgi:hypothetical protein